MTVLLSLFKLALCAVAVYGCLSMCARKKKTPF
jgi:hypothetical protein